MHTWKRNIQLITCILYLNTINMHVCLCVCIPTFGRSLNSIIGVSPYPIISVSARRPHWRFLHLGHPISKFSLCRSKHNMLREALHHSAQCIIILWDFSLSPEIAMNIRDLLLQLPEDHLYDILKQIWLNALPLRSKADCSICSRQKNLGIGNPCSCCVECSNYLVKRQWQWMARSLKSFSCSGSQLMYTNGSGGPKPEDSLGRTGHTGRKIVEVAVPSIATVSTPTQAISKVENLSAEGDRYRLCRQEQGLDSADCTVRIKGRHRSPSQSKVCWYHRRFGDAACKCTVPSTKSENRQAGNYWWQVLLAFSEVVSSM